MPKLAAPVLPRRLPLQKQAFYLFVFFVLFAIPLFASHFWLISLPLFWDELGQFVPTALDILRSGAWVARSTIPNVHPPGVEAYLALCYRLFGYSIPATRLAMLLVAGVGTLATFLLAVELSRETKRALALLAPVFLLVSPLFYTQSMMAQLDMPAMVLTCLALLFFLHRQHGAAAVSTVALVLVKETGIVVPFVFFIVLVLRKDWKRPALFILPAMALLGWLFVLHRATGYWLGNPDFAHYNVGYSLHPVRIALSCVRHVYYIFFAEFRWIGTLAIAFAAIRSRVFCSLSWRITLACSGLSFLLVSVLGGAELERYLLPVLAVFYIAVAVALTFVRKWVSLVAAAALVVGLIGSLFWNPPYPFPYENNLAMVDFVRLQALAASYAENNFAGETIATAWPYTAALKNPDFGFVDRKLKVIETNDFHPSSLIRLAPSSFQVLIVYTRTWAPQTGVIAIPLVHNFLARFYDYQPQITPEQLNALGLHQVVNWRLRGQEISIYSRDRLRPEFGQR